MNICTNLNAQEVASRNITNRKVGQGTRLYRVRKQENAQEKDLRTRQERKVKNTNWDKGPSRERGTRNWSRGHVRSRDLSVGPTHLALTYNQPRSRDSVTNASS